MRPLLAALALLALPLAGCAAPALPPAAPAAAAPDTLLPRTGAAAGAWSQEVPSCPLAEERREQARLRELLITVKGCLAASVPVWPVGGLPDDVRVDFDVGPGATSLLVLLHLDGPGPLNGTLAPPGTPTREGEPRTDAGDAERDAMLRWELAAPPPGAWRLRGWLDEVGAALPWTATVVVAYA